MKVWTGRLTIVIGCACAAGLALGSPVQVVPQASTSGLRGGATTSSICADKVENTTTSCFEREYYHNDQKYRCLGNKLDQVCKAATVNSMQVCEKSGGKCGGKKEKYDKDNKVWVADGDNCNGPYTKAQVVKGDCTPATAGAASN